MANLVVLDGASATKYIKTTGAGSSGDPFASHHVVDSGAITETNSGAIKTAVETIDNAISGNEILIAGGATQTNDVKVTLDSEAVVISSGSIAVTNTVEVSQATHDNLNLNANIQVGDADASGANPVPVYQQAIPVVTNASTSGSINTSYDPGSPFWLDVVTCGFSSAPTSAGSFTITLNANDGAAYDVLLDSIDPSVVAVADLVYQPDGGPLLCEAGDAIDVLYTNPNSRLSGLRIVTRLA